MYSLKISSYAENDLYDIFAYISNENKSAALKLISQIQNKFDDIVQFPLSGASLTERTDFETLPENYRYFIVKPYIIFYKVIDEQKTIIIARILHSRQNYLQILFGSDL